MAQITIRSVRVTAVALVASSKTRYASSVRELILKHRRFFAISLFSGFALRLVFIFWLPRLSNDSFVYGDIAKNWLQHGVYGMTDTGVVLPTYIRLPGYPAFLALIFTIFGMEHYRAALIVQMFVDMGTCVLIADLARRIFSGRVARAAFLLAAICPFLADYVSAALTETLEIFFTVLALDFAVAGLQHLSDFRKAPWVGCGVALGAAILLRPDGGLLLASIEIFLAITFVRSLGTQGRAKNFSSYFRAIAMVGCIALAPLVPWTARNWHTFHRVQPLAPRYANQQDEYVAVGFNRWIKTWIIDYASTEEVFWAVPGAQLDPEILPDRAFNSPEQRDQTLQVIADYNESHVVSPEIDGRFAEIANERIHHSPLRYYVLLPAARIADMWMRPRTEKLPCNSRWWEFDEDWQWMTLMIALGVINLLYLFGAAVGLVKSRVGAPLLMLLLFVVLRSLFLGTMENPETRYTLECYPVVILLGSVWVQRLRWFAD
jgi:4-amino-4-deoxy-L-arabinose transferase-like glycosyltransferase